VRESVNQATAAMLAFRGVKLLEVEKGGGDGQA
jgi:hypothetical protein